MFRNSVESFGETPAIVSEFTTYGGDRLSGQSKPNSRDESKGELEGEPGRRSYNYLELCQAVDTAAKALISMGLQPKDRASIWAPNMVEWVIVALGIQSAGGVLVPLNTRFKGKEASYVLERSGTKFLFCVRNFLGTDYLDLLYDSPYDEEPSNTPSTSILPELTQIILLDFPGAKSGDLEPAHLREKDSKAERNILADIFSWEDFLVKSKEGSDENLTEILEERIQNGSGEDLSDIMFTSGTTGLPKGVMTTHYQSLRGYKSWSECVGLKSGDRYLVVNPFFHAFGYKSGWLASFMTGATVYPKAVFDVADVMSAVAEHKITMLPGPPTLYQSILNHPDFEEFDLSSLRLAVTGAAVIPVELILEMRERLNFENIVTGYGLTESSGIATMCRAGDDPEIIATTSGRAIPDVEVIVADEQGNKVETKIPGEVLIRGYNVTQGYLDDAEATSATIDENGWLKTGDIGVMDKDGNLAITDRKKDMFIMGGFNAYPAEIENLMLTHSAIAQVAVVGVPDEKFGEVGVAFVVLRKGQPSDPKLAPTMEELTGWCKDNMANYKVPRHITFMDTLPTNASGKVLKYELREKFVRNL